MLVWFIFRVGLGEMVAYVSASLARRPSLLEIISDEIGTRVHTKKVLKKML
jgi:hypothetical protein